MLRDNLHREGSAAPGCHGSALLPQKELAEGASRLEADLQSGDWDRRYGHLRDLPALDVGYRLVIAHSRIESGRRPQLGPHQPNGVEGPPDSRETSGEDKKWSRSAARVQALLKCRDGQGPRRELE